MKRASKKPLQIDVLTLFPQMVDAYLHEAMLLRGQKAGALKLASHDLRTWTHDNHHTVDDRPFGGGPGMVMQIAPFHEALMALRVRKQDGQPTATAKRTRVIVTSASGKPFTQQEAVRLATYDRLVFLCGRYEGIDARVEEHLADEAFSVGPYVLTGGELPALIMADAIARLRPGVLGKQASLDAESHTEKGVLEYPQYTRPEIYAAGKQTWNVPDVLLGGNHAEIAKWRVQQQKRAS